MSKFSNPMQYYSLIILFNVLFSNYPQKIILRSIFTYILLSRIFIYHDINI